MNSHLIRTAIVTVSDTRTVDNDLSGDKLVELLASIGADVGDRMIVTDDLMHLRETLHVLAERDDINLILTTGGTGFGPRDNTPEATRGVIEREAPGLAEAMRRETAAKTPLSMLSRGICGIRGNTLIVNLPGQPRALRECLDAVFPAIPYCVDLIGGPYLTTNESKVVAFRPKK